jgi:hypothetical protein
MRADLSGHSLLTPASKVLLVQVKCARPKARGHSKRSEREKSGRHSERAEANARAQDVESDAPDENPGLCCADCVCAH